MSASSSPSRKTPGAERLDAPTKEAAWPLPENRISLEDFTQPKRRMSESQTTARPRRMSESKTTAVRPKRTVSPKEERQPRRKAGASSPNGSTTSASSRGKRFSVGESEDETDSDDPDSDDSDSGADPSDDAGDDSYSSSMPGSRTRTRSRTRPTVKIPQPQQRDVSRGRRTNRSRSVSRAGSKATSASRRTPVDDTSTPTSSTSRVPPVQNGLLKRTMSHREMPSPQRRASNAAQDISPVKRAMSHHDLANYGRAPAPPLPAALPSPERPRKGQYPFQSFIGEDPALENKVSEVVRSRSQSRSRPLNGAAVAASAAAAFAAAIPPPPPVPSTTALYPATSFVGEGAASISAPNSTNVSPVVGPGRPAMNRSMSTPPRQRQLQRSGTAPVGGPAPYEALGRKAPPTTVARAASSAAVLRPAIKRSASTPPTSINAQRRPLEPSYLAMGLVESEAAAKGMQGLPQGPHPPSRRPSLYPFQSYVGEDPTAETRAVERSKSVRPPAAPSRSKYAPGPGVAVAAAVASVTTAAAPAEVATPRRPVMAMYPATSFVGEDSVVRSAGGSNQSGLPAVPRPKVLLPAAYDSARGANVDKAAAFLADGSIVASPADIRSRTVQAEAPRLSLKGLPSALIADEKRIFAELARDAAQDGARPPKPINKGVDAAAADDNAAAAAQKRPPVRTLGAGTLNTRRTESNSESPVVANPQHVPPIADRAAAGFVDLEKGLPQPAATIGYGSSIASKAAAAAGPPPPRPAALRGGEMTWFYNENMGTKGPRAWKKRTWAILVALIALIIIVAVAVPMSQQQVLAKRAWFNTYPDYARLNYSLSDTYSGANFFDRFHYFEGYDPTQGHVHYVNRIRAEQLNLTYASDSSAVLRVDATVGPGDEPDASTGRFSVRLESRDQYDRGLFVFDVAHTPVGCGAWPALWLASLRDWPRFGEIDVMEATNRGVDGNVFSLHTTRGCEMVRRREMTGVAKQTDCYNGTNANQGCNVAGPPETYGQAFNSRGGGVVALELRDEGIRMWQFARPDVPRDLQAAAGLAAPDPASWGKAMADFPGTDCDVGTHFRNQSIIINITLCGHLTEAVWKDSGCPGTCVKHVSDNPEAFRDAFWQFNGLRVYKAERS